jgi:hypothetical protein
MPSTRMVASKAALPGFLCGSLVSSDIGWQASHPQYAKTHRMLPRATAEADEASKDAWDDTFKDAYDRALAEELAKLDDALRSDD